MRFALLECRVAFRAFDRGISSIHVRTPDKTANCIVSSTSFAVQRDGQQR